MHKASRVWDPAKDKSVLRATRIHNVSWCYYRPRPGVKCRDARVYGHTTTAMHVNEPFTASAPPPLAPRRPLPFTVLSLFPQLFFFFIFHNLSCHLKGFDIAKSHAYPSNGQHLSRGCRAAARRAGYIDGGGAARAGIGGGGGPSKRGKGCPWRGEERGRGTRTLRGDIHLYEIENQQKQRTAMLSATYLVHVKNKAITTVNVL